MSISLTDYTLPPVQSFQSIARPVEERGLGDGIKVTTRYRDLTDQAYETEWNLDPTIYGDGRYVRHQDTDDLIDSVDRLTGEVRKKNSA